MFKAGLAASDLLFSQAN